MTPIFPPKHVVSHILKESGESFPYYTCDDYFNIEFEISFPFFGSNHAVEFLKKIGLAGKLVYDSSMNRHNGKRIIKIHFPFYQAWGVSELEPKLTQIFNPEYLTFKKRFVPAFETNWDLLKYLWETMDWDYAYSDDHGVWAGGNAQEAHYKALAKALAKIDRARVEKLASNFNRLTPEVIAAIIK